jgi:hypothetical protein
MTGWKDRRGVMDKFLEWLDKEPQNSEIDSIGYMIKYLLKKNIFILDVIAKKKTIDDIYKTLKREIEEEDA